jgi:predicted permease
MRSTPRALTSPDSALLEVVARLAPGATPEQATSMVRVVATAWVPERPRSADPIEYASDVVPLRGVTDLETGRPMAAGGDPTLTFQLGALGTAALLVLLVACTNVSALMVGAAVKRRREIAIRLSLGASRRRVVRQLVTESSLIALAGGALGLTIYWWITWLMSWWMGQDMGVGPDLGTIGFTTFVALGTGIVFGLSPALHATRLDVATALKDTGGGTSRTRLQRVLIVAQIGLTQPLLVGIAMVIWIARINGGGNNRETPLAGRVTKVEFGINGGAGTREAKAARIAELMKQVAALPGVEAVVPQSTVVDFGAFRVHPADRGAGPRAEQTVPLLVEGTPPGYFAFHNTVMLRGRDLVASDTSGRDMAVVIDAALARGFWGPVDPIGKRLQMTTEEYKQNPRTAVVVGVFDSAQAPVRGSGRVYTADRARWSEDTYLVRTRDAGAVLAAPIRQLARTTLPDIPIYQNGIATLEQLLALERREMLQVSAAAAGGGGLTLLLASIGLYGVVALAVRQRHREIGIRVALGARPGQVIGMFFASGLRLSVTGLVLGLPLSVVALYALASGIAGEPLTTLSGVMAMSAGAIAVVVTAVASLATWIPARRAARVDALEAIRVE